MSASFREAGDRKGDRVVGMNVASGPELAAAVTNAGGLGVIGGLGYTPERMRNQLNLLKSLTSGPFGVDLALPQVGGGARKTNYDYTHGHLAELIQIICDSGARLFVSAVGVPPRWVVDQLHAAGILVMNMCGAPHHALKAVAAGCDILCCQGGEGGGHTGSIPTPILVPACVDVLRGLQPPRYVVAAGGIYDGRGLATALCLGAQAVWVGTRFIAATEAGAGPRHQQAVLDAGFHDTMKTTIYSGRPLRTLRTPYILSWENGRQAELKSFLQQGIIPFQHDAENNQIEDPLKAIPLLMGKVAGNINQVLPAAEIVNGMVTEAVETLRRCAGSVSSSL